MQVQRGGCNGAPYTPTYPGTSYPAASAPPAAYQQAPGYPYPDAVGGYVVPPMYAQPGLPAYPATPPLPLTGPGAMPYNNGVSYPAPGYAYGDGVAPGYPNAGYSGGYPYGTPSAAASIACSCLALFMYP